MLGYPLHVQAHLTSSFLPGKNTYLTSSWGKTIQKNNVQRERRQMTWQMIWSIWFTTDKWQYLQLWGNWSDINQHTVKYESSTRVLNCVSVLKPVRNWSFPLHAAWETLRGRDSIRAVMLRVLWAFKGNRSQSGDCVQICWLLFWRGKLFILCLSWRRAAVIFVSHP